MCIDRVVALLYYRTRHYYNYVHCTYIVNILSAKRLVSMHMFMYTLCTCSHGHVSNNLYRTLCYDVLRYLRFPKLKKIQFILIFRFLKTSVSTSFLSSLIYISLKKEYCFYSFARIKFI